MGGALVVPCWQCGKLLELWVTEPEERGYFHKMGASCQNKLRRNYDGACRG